MAAAGLNAQKKTCPAINGALSFVMSSSLEPTYIVSIKDANSGVFDIKGTFIQNKKPSDLKFVCLGINSEFIAKEYAKGNKIYIRDKNGMQYSADQNGNINIPQSPESIESIGFSSESSSGSNILSIICCILILGGIGYGAYYYYTTNLDNKVTKKISGGVFDVGE